MSLKLDRRVSGVVLVRVVAGLTVVLMTGASACGAQVDALDAVAVFEVQSGGCHALKAVGLDDAKRLVVQGSVCMKKPFALHRLTHRGHYVIAHLWTEIEVYDFTDPKRPQFVRSFTLDETHTAWGGGGLVHEGDKLLVLGTTVSAELSLLGAPSEWRVRNIDVTPELRRRTESLYSGELRQKDPADMLEGGAPRRAARWRTVRGSLGHDHPAPRPCSPSAVPPRAAVGRGAPHRHERRDDRLAVWASRPSRARARDGSSGRAPTPLRLGLAALLSCSVYALPLVGPHAIFFLGESLLSATRHERPIAWIATEISVALAMQIGAGAIWYWILGHPLSLRPFVLVIAVPAFFAVAEWCYLIALPTRFLIERDVKVEQRAWSAACTVPNESLVVVGYKPVTVGAGDTLLVSDSTARLARLTITTAPGTATTCAVSSLGLPPPTAHVSPVWIGDDGRALLSSTGKNTGSQAWLWIAARGATPTPLDEPPGRRSIDGPPVISRDGHMVAWLTPMPNSGQPPALSIVVRRLPTPETFTTPPVAPGDVLIDLSRLGPASVVLREVDTKMRAVVLALNERTFVTVGFDGVVRGSPLRPEGVDMLHMTFRRVGDGWIAWDGYKEDGYTIAWSLPAGRGSHRVPKGRSITDVGVHPDGRLIAVSVTTSLSIGDVRDAVYVLRAADGGEVFRHYLPRYARSAVLFPSRDLFAYTDWDGTGAATVVLRIPSDALR